MAAIPQLSEEATGNAPAKRWKGQIYVEGRIAAGASAFMLLSAGYGSETSADEEFPFRVTGASIVSRTEMAACPKMPRILVAGGQFKVFERALLAKLLSWPTFRWFLV